MKSNLLIIIALTLVLSTSFAVDLTATSNGTCYVTQGSYNADNSSVNTSNSGNSTNQSIMVYFFYGNGCPHCAIVEPLIDSLAAKYSQINFLKLEVYYNSSNLALFQNFNAHFGVKNPEVPSVFIGDQALIGEDAIQNSLEPDIQRLINIINNTSHSNESNAGSAGANSSTNLTNPLPSENSTNPFPATNLTIATVIVASIADSLNPCALSVMIFLLIFLTSLGDMKRVLKVGIVYIITVYLVYFITGLGTLTFLQSSSMTRDIYYVAAILSMIIGLINIKDYFFFGKGPSLAIPESGKPTIKRYIERASIPAAVTLGAVVSLYELPCTGGIYLAILSLLGNRMTLVEGIPYLALYNVIFVLPLIVILVILYRGVSAEKMNSWRLDKRKSLRLVMGLVMLLLGLVMIFGAI